MNRRWIGGILLAAALSLAACAPQPGGAGESTSVSPVSDAAAPSETPEPMESAEPSESAEPTPDDYEY
jgi:hypothetical protein